LFDTGIRDQATGLSDADASKPEDAEFAASGMTAFRSRLSDLRLSAERSLKLYSSASRLALGQSLGQRRWLVATGVAGALSFGLLATGLVALVAPYSGVETAALTAEDTPQIIAHNAAHAEHETLVATHVPAAPAELMTADAGNIALRAQTEDVTGGDSAEDTASIAELSDSDTASDLPDNAELVTASLAPSIPALPTETSTLVELDPGATLMQVLTDNGADRVDAYHAIAALRPIFSPTKLRSGQEISLTFLTTPAAEDSVDGLPSKLLTAISLQPDVERKIEVQRGDDGSFTSEQIKREMTSGYARAEGTISSSLFLDAAQAGVPAPIIVEMIRMFSYSVDFQREIHPGDTFQVFFDRKYDAASGAPVKEGDISFAALTILGKSHKLWRYKSADGTWDYFDENGRSMKKFLMKTPIDGARISSGFGARKHPILGYTKMHMGVDFAAPRGTPIYAAGNGKVEIAGWTGGYGKFVRIKHANGYETGYGHMNGFASGIRPGVSVRQGQVIGYVGTTGRSTGPHLHYEISVRGKKVNPLGIKVPTGTQLAGKDLKAYKGARAEIMAQMAETPELTKVAQANTGEKDSKAN
tara:strand:+ start:513 stop:2276 length:1764 start_codon:yes stop_codon:yes gene_type:complete